jgi:hypothetical protein
MRRKLRDDVAIATAVDGAYIGPLPKRSQQPPAWKNEKKRIFVTGVPIAAFALWIEPPFGLKGAMIAGPKLTQALH